MAKKSVFVGIGYGISMCTGENEVSIYWKVYGKHYKSYHVKCNGGGMNMLKRIIDSDNYKCTIVSIDLLIPNISYQIKER